MATIAQYLTELNVQKKALADNLNTMGVTAGTDEKLNTLVPKVLECKGEQIVEFVDNTILEGTVYVPGFYKSILKVNIPNGITKIGDNAFYECESISCITIPNSVTAIGRCAFYICKGLKDMVIPNSVTSLEPYAFYMCSGLTSVTISNSITSIEERTFYGCTNLTSITLPDSVTSIGLGAFLNSGLVNIIIPDSVTSIGDKAFYGCMELTNIYYTGTEEQWNAITKGSDWDLNIGAHISGGTVIHYNYTG